MTPLWHATPSGLAATIVGLACLALAAGAVAAETAVAVPERIEFNRDVRPILADNCFYCHGPDASHRKAKLRLDLREPALAREAFVPGRPEESELVLRIRSKDEDEMMPPPDSHKTLSARDKAVLERWVAQGAEYQKHWSFETPRKAPIPAGSNGVDVLVGRRLAEVGLQPAPEADRRTLVRRLYADLLGLPPEPREVEAFVADPAPDAYEKLVDRLLANPHYGERMAVGWLDVVRFADTIGYHSDNPRNVWPYRDWVIRSFNTNKPFDRFTQEQIAGDLLPDASVETRVGSAFNRLLLSTEEGGAQPKDYETRMLADRVRAIGTAWLGLTTGCAQCHDHKFDPITQKDFYALGAFFADVKEAAIGRREDGLLVTTPEQDVKLLGFDAAVKETEAAVGRVASAIDTAQAAWENERRESPAERALPRDVAAALRKAAGTRNARERQVIRTHFRTKVSAVGRTELDALGAAEAARKAYVDTLPRCLVTETTTQKRVVRVLARGDWMDETGEVVSPALPGFLAPPAAAGRALNRLDLAQRLVARDNPLTARAFVNRLWRQLFGVALSRVPSDLGAQGELPPNGPLLDWLACEFMDRGWDVKHLVRTIVTSATYRRASTAAPELIARDPENREHARQGRFRIEAEFVRDYALAAGGLLAAKIGGPSVKPYQPERYWENLNFPPRDYVVDQGEAQYRRGLYVWWQRTFLHPSLLAFDAPSREECAAERNRSNLPQQALVLLNDPTYVEAARGFAQNVLKHGGASVASRLDYAWKRALQRAPRAEEVRTAAAVLDEHLKIYRGDRAAAEALLATGEAPAPAGVDLAEAAAWTHVARILLNLHEFITRS